MRPIDWRKAVRDSDLESITKLVLHTISVHVNPEQDFVFPSIRYIAEGASIAPSTAQVHVDKAVAAGFLIKENTRRRKGGKGSNRYYLEIPDDLAKKKPKQMGEIDHREPVIDDHREAVQGVPGAGDLSNMSTEHEEKDTTVSKKNDELREFFENTFWPLFPKQRAGSKDKAFSAFLKAVEREKTTARIMRGLRAYVNSREVALGYAKGAAAWLNDDRWTSSYSSKEGNDQGTPRPPQRPFREDRPAPRYDETTTNKKIF